MKIENILSQIKNFELSGKNKKNIVYKLAEIYNKSISEINNYIIELEKAGQLFCDKKGKLSLVKDLGYQIGVLNGNVKGFCFCVLEDTSKDDVFIANSNLNSAMHSDKVLIRVEKNKRDGREEGFVEKVLQRGVKTIVGTIEVFAKFSFVVPDNKKIFKDVFIKKGDERGAKTGDKVFVQIESYDGKNMQGGVLEILGSGKGDINTDVLSIIRSYELIEEFSKELLESAKSIPQSIDANKFPNRTDLRKDLIFTIDGDDTKDFDDAISLTRQGDNYILGVHIADVGEYVKQNSLLDREAFERGTSVYFPNCVLPMLPRELSNGICSLNPQQDRLALSCVTIIDKSGNILEHKLFESIINSAEKMTYNNVTAILNGDSELNNKYNKIVPTLKLMAELNGILEEKRAERGCIDFDIPEAKIILNPKTLEVESLSQRPRTISERIIESFMLTANEVVAQHFKNLGAPFVYRIHEAPEQDKILSFNEFVGAMGYSLQGKKQKLEPKEVQNFMSSIKDDGMKEVINSILLRSMQKAKYSPDCLGHFGLAATYYCHFTSPIRRYPDLTIHRIIKEYLHSDITSKRQTELKTFVVKASQQSSEREIFAQRAERDVDDYFMCRYMRDKIGNIFEGVISSVTNFGIFVKLENTVEGLVSIVALPGDRYIFNDKNLSLSNNANCYKLGDKITIKVDNVNMDQRNIDFVLSDVKNN